MIPRIAITLALAIPIPALAHPTDCNGKAQPAVIMSGCCGKEDYRALHPNEVRADGPGWDVYLEGAWHPARHSYGDHDWIIAQPTLSQCWGIWYRKGTQEAGGNVYYYSHSGNVPLFTFYCLEQPATG